MSAGEQDNANLAKVFAALANPHRLRIYESLFSGGLSTCCDRIEKCESAVAQTDVVRLLGLAQSTISHYLKVLETAGLVTTERRGPWTCYFPNYDQAARIGTFFDELATRGTPPRGSEQPLASGQP